MSSKGLEQNTTKLVNSVSRNTAGFVGNSPMKPKKTLKRSTVIIFAVIAAIIGFGAIVLLDKVIMPWYVKLGAVAKVPNVNGIKYEEAENKLQKLGFEVKKSEPRFDAQAPAGTVIMQIPYAGSITKQGRRIYLTVSKGENLEFVPNLVGLPLRQARINLIRVGMDVGEIIYEFCDTIGRDLVSGQAIQSTAMARPGTKIDVKISRGQAAVQTMMPSLMGLSLQDAKVKLGNAGLSMGKINYKESEAYEENTIIAQSVSAYVAVPQYSRVNITVCVKPGMLPKPDTEPAPVENKDSITIKKNNLQEKINQQENAPSPANKPLSSGSPNNGLKSGTAAVGAVGAVSSKKIITPKPTPKANIDKSTRIVKDISSEQKKTVSKPVVKSEQSKTATNKESTNKESTNRSSVNKTSVKPNTANKQLDKKATTIDKASTSKTVTSKTATSKVATDKKNTENKPAQNKPATKKLAPEKKEDNGLPTIKREP